MVARSAISPVHDVAVAKRLVESRVSRGKSLGNVVQFLIGCIENGGTNP